MARVIQVLLLCDPCLKDDQRVDGEEFVLTIAGLAASKPRALVLCEVHRKEFYDPIHDLMAELGQPVATSPKIPRKLASPDAEKTPSKVSAAEPEAQTCPECGRVLKNLQTAQTHARAQHHSTWNALNGIVLAHACQEPGCGVSYNLPQHLARHMNVEHAAG